MVPGVGDDRDLGEVGHAHATVGRLRHDSELAFLQDDSPVARFIGPAGNAATNHRGGGRIHPGFHRPADPRGPGSDIDRIIHAVEHEPLAEITHLPRIVACGSTDGKGRVVVPVVAQGGVVNRWLIREDVLPLGLPHPGGVVETVSRRSRIPVAAHGQVGLNPGGRSGNGLDNIPNEVGKVEVISLQGDGLFDARWNHSRHGDFDPEFDLAACGQNRRAVPGGADEVCGDVGGSVPVGGSPTRCGALGSPEQDGAGHRTIILRGDGE